MNPNPFKQKPGDQREPAEQNQDPWTWGVIGLAFVLVIVALYGPLVWQLTHDAM
jgi:hypothetical protein